jgi:hypothetical protein
MDGASELFSCYFFWLLFYSEGQLNMAAAKNHYDERSQAAILIFFKILLYFLSFSSYDFSSQYR